MAHAASFILQGRGRAGVAPLVHFSASALFIFGVCLEQSMTDKPADVKLHVVPTGKVSDRIVAVRAELELTERRIAQLKQEAVRRRTALLKGPHPKN